jgi:hypothetical protein
VNVYPTARTALLAGDLDMDADPLALVLVGPPFAFDPADAWLSDITGTIGVAQTVTVTDVTDAQVHCASVTFPAVADGAHVTGVVLFRGGVDPASSLLIGCVDRRADSVPLSLMGNGGDLTFTFPDYLLTI